MLIQEILTSGIILLHRRIISLVFPFRFSVFSLFLDTHFLQCNTETHICHQLRQLPTYKLETANKICCKSSYFNKARRSQRLAEQSKTEQKHTEGEKSQKTKC